MNVYVNDISIALRSIVERYNRLNTRLHLDTEGSTQFKFNDQSDLIGTLVSCRDIIVSTLKVYTYMMEDTVSDISYDHMRDLYKRSQIRVTYAIIYHDLKNVFEILDIAASDRSNTITVNGITADDIENVYVTMVSFMLETIKSYNIKFGTGGAAKRGPRKRGAASQET